VVASDVDHAYATCLALARSHYENFPVASWLMPAAARPHVAAIYAFARIADDFADEGTAAESERLARLDGWQARLDHAAQGRVHPAGHQLHDAVFEALARTLTGPALGTGGVMVHGLLSDLLSAFRQDVTVRRYERWDDVMDYCRRSANPVGRLVLIVTGQFTDAAAARADAVCTALQLTNFWQDLAIDWSRGRLYVPLQLVRDHGADIRALDEGRLDQPWTQVMRDVGGRTATLFDEGRAVADDVRGRLKWELRATWLGGRSILDRLAEADYDVFTRRPTLTKWNAIRLIPRVVAWRNQ
jgi:squalene synthase HpnC